MSHNNKAREARDIHTVYLHGFGGDKDGLAELAKVLDFPNTVNVDMPGFGDNTTRLSESAIEDIGAYADMVHEYIGRLTSGAESVRLIGHSHGAMVAYVLALKYPLWVDSLVLLCPVARTTFIGRLFLSASGWLARTIGYRRVVRILSLKPVVDLITLCSWAPGWDRKFFLRVLHKRRREAKRYDASMLQMIYSLPKMVADYDSTSLSQVALIVVAQSDRLVAEDDVEWYKKRIPAGVVADEKLRGGHLMPVQHPHQLADIIRQYDLEQ